MKKQCNHDTVLRRVRRCQIMADSDECLMCRLCDLHFHVAKGSRESAGRKILNENPLPWTPLKAVKASNDS